jgi:hypothetical protein
MIAERSANITVGSEEYELILTTKAAKEIAGRYGGLESLGEKLMKSENFEMSIGETVWLIWECHKQYHGMAKPKHETYIDDIILDGI